MRECRMGPFIAVELLEQEFHPTASNANPAGFPPYEFPPMPQQALGTGDN